jgi:hypothetical protein
VPVARSTGHAGKALLVAGVGVAVALGVMWAIASMDTGGSVQRSFGEQIFEPGRAENLARLIEDDRAPILYPSLAEGGRPIYVQHLGDDPEEGWTALGAFDPDDPSCAVTWSIDDQVFVNDCDESVTYPPDGTGLRRYETVVRDGVVRVDVAGITTTTTTTTTVADG